MMNHAAWKSGKKYKDGGSVQSNKPDLNKMNSDEMSRYYSEW